MERVLQRRIEHHLENNKVFSATQCGFRRNRSTTDILAILKHNIVESKKDKEYCLVTYLDLESAYDCVWHAGLITKVKSLGIHDDILKLLTNYLKDCTIKVRIGARESRNKPLTRGLPQGAVLSPTLFNVMLYDIPKSQSVKVVSYADDITLLTSNRDIQEAQQDMQNYLRILTTWLGKWKFILNPSKCSFQIFTNKRSIPNVNLQVARQQIPQTEQQRVLGVIFDAPKLTLSHHLTYLKNDCNKRLGAMRSISSNRIKLVIHQLYPEQVRIRKCHV